MSHSAHGSMCRTKLAAWLTTTRQRPTNRIGGERRERPFWSADEVCLMHMNSQLVCSPLNQR